MSLSALSPMEKWFFLQFILEGILILLMVFFLIRLKQIGRRSFEMPSEVQEAMERFLEESERLSTAFSRNLEQKKDLTMDLLLKLERKTNDMRELLERAEQHDFGPPREERPEADPDRANPAAPENRTMVLRLAGRGLSVEEIARKVRLHRGEVELILDLEKHFTAPSS